MYKCTSATVTVHICTVTVSLAFNIFLFFLSLPHSLFFSLVWLSPHALFYSNDLHCSIESSHSCAIADHLTRCCSHRSPLPPQSPLLSPIVIAIFFLCLMVLGFWWSTAPLLSQVLPQLCHYRSPHSLLLMPNADRYCLANRRCSPIAIAIFFFGSS